MTPTPEVLLAMVEAAVGGTVLVGGYLAVRHEIRSGDTRADNLARQVEGNHHLGAPFTQPAKAATGRPCRGRLVVHRDGRTTCHGGPHDCPGEASRHRKQVSCADQGHGCGECDNGAPTGPTFVVRRPAPAGPELCTRGCGRPGTEFVAAPGSLPTLVCVRCRDAIADGRTFHGTRTT